jgi:molecular chaperone GrpE
VSRKPIHPKHDEHADTPRRESAAAGETLRHPAAEGADRRENEPTAASGPLESLRADLAAAQERLLRSQAELENYRKRVAREMAEQDRYANLPLMRDLLPVWDNLQRAIAAGEKTHDANQILEGVQMVAMQFQNVLEQHHCVPIETLHQPFDPHVHEAVSQQPSGDHPANTVIMVTQPGYQLHDRVVRPSQVIVSTPHPSEAPAQDDDADPE